MACLYFENLNIHQYSETIANATTAIALLVAGLWALQRYSRERHAAPCGIMTVRVSHYSLTATDMLLRVELRLENRGKVLIRIASGTVRLQQLLPCDPTLLNWLKSEMEQQGANATEAPWTQIGLDRNIADAQYEIEPGESESVYFDFFVGSVESVLVYSHLVNEKKHGKQIGWNAATVYSLKTNPEGEPGTQTMLTTTPQSV